MTVPVGRPIPIAPTVAVKVTGWPKTLVAGEPEKFLMPEPSDMRFRWVRCRLAAIDADEMRELVLDAWRMVVPKSVALAYKEVMKR